MESGESQQVHTFKNYLHLTLSYCALLLDELPDDSPMRRDIEEIEGAVRRAVDMLPELLTSVGQDEPGPPQPAPIARRP
jgi:hypothetical protein